MQTDGCKGHPASHAALKSGSNSNSVATKCSLWRQRLQQCTHRQQQHSQHHTFHHRQHQAPFHRKHNISTLSAAAASTDSPSTISSSSNEQQHQQQPDVPVAGDVLTNVVCDRLGTAGVGVCTAPPSRFILLIKGALPGEKLVAKITIARKGCAEGIKLQTLSPHSNAAMPLCQHFGTCGGCSLQSITYEAQLRHKVNHVAQLFTRVGKLSPQLVEATRQPPVAAAAGQQYRYRNKIQLAFSTKVWKSATSGSSNSSADLDLDHDQIRNDHGRTSSDLIDHDHTGLTGQVVDGWGLGFYSPGSNAVVMSVNECSLVGTEANALLAGVRYICQQHGLQPYNPDTGEGQLRHLIIRTAATLAVTTVAAAASDADAIVDSRQDISNTIVAADAACSSGGGGSTQLMAVFVTTAACQSSELQPVADELMKRYRHLGLVSVIHSIEATAAAATQQTPAVGRKSKGSNQRNKTARGSHSRNSLQKGQATTSSSSSRSQGARALSITSSTMLAGVSHLTEQLCGLQFVISPHSFFQTNTAQAQQLYRQVVQAVQQYYQQTAAAAAAVTEGSQDTGVVLDLYTGTGTIALSIASSNCCKQVVGFDVSQSSIADAQANAARNNISNVEFVCGDLNQLARDDLLGSTVKPDVVVVDPARAGLGAEVVEYLLRSGAKRVIYVSCNAATQARDLQLLCGADGAVGAVAASAAGLRPTGRHRQRSLANGSRQEGDAGPVSWAMPGTVEHFAVCFWTAVDMYPQTAVEHVETVVVLDRL